MESVTEPIEPTEPTTQTTLISTVIEPQALYSDREFWEKLLSIDIHFIKDRIEYLLYEFGTKEPCNRFDIGNSIEFIINEYITAAGFQTSELPNAKRFDVNVHDYKPLSIKYSSCGDITLHNSNSTVNKDMEMKDTILLTPEKIYLITNAELAKHQIDIQDYIQNTGDSLKLKRKIVKILHDKQYPFMHDIHINHYKKECKNRLCSKLFYQQVMKEYNDKQNSQQQQQPI